MESCQKLRFAVVALSGLVWKWGNPYDPGMRNRCLASVFAVLFGSQQLFAVDDVSEKLEAIRKEAGIPALGGAAIVDGELKALGVVGLRKAGGEEPVTVDDKWHIGSCTKSMTATLAATFVEEGKLKWTTTIGEILGKEMDVREDYRDVTLATLLTNRSGIPGKAPRTVWSKAWQGTGKADLMKRRKDYAEAMLGEKPEFKPGTDYAYSNSGFIVVGAMLEQLTGKLWEDLMKERIFEPLKMTSAGFGSAATIGKEDQPWGHHSVKLPQKPGVKADNPDVLGPAGTVHISLRDLARYVKMHATHEVGPVLKKPETFTFLQTKGEGNKDYACGWIVLERGWAKGPALMHNGSNTMNYCVIWMAPERKFGGIAVSNIKMDLSGIPCDTVVGKLIEAYLK